MRSFNKCAFAVDGRQRIKGGVVFLDGRQRD
jgi:hypothetical protein